MATACSIAQQCASPPIKASSLPRALRNIVLGIIAAIALSYAEYRMIEQAPAFAAACLVALSSDFQPVLNATSDDTPRVPVAD